MKKLVISSFFFTNLILSQAMPSGMSLDDDYLESLPESVRKDLEDEIQKSQEDKSSLKKRPSTELLKYEVVNEWEEFQKQRKDEINKSERFGLKLFKTMQSSFMPINEPNFGNNYILDYGDVIEVSLFGNTTMNFEAEINRDGTINFPELGSITLGGLNYQQGVDKILAKVESSYIGTKAIINLKEIRDIKVLVTGNVDFPGIYTLSGNSNVLQALNIAGGVNEAGTLRDIEIKRNGEIISSVDIYDALIFGNISNLNQLQSGDAIYVKPAKKLIRAGSGFINQATFELKESENLTHFFKLTGGVNPATTKKTFTLIGVDGSVDNNISIESKDLHKYKLEHLDSIYFDTLDIGTVKVLGQVQRPGSYSIKPGDDLYDLLNRAGGYNDVAYPLASILTRMDVKKLEEDYIKKSYKNIIAYLVQNPDKLQANTGIGKILEEFKMLEPSGRVVAEFDLQNLEEDPKKRTLLQDGDVIHIASKSNFVYVYGDVGNPQALSFVDMNPASYYISLAGGINRTADKSHVLIISPNGEASLLNMSKFTKLLKNNIDIYPGTLINVPQKIGSVQGVEFYSVIAPIFSSLALTLASLNAISD